jgi:hypothetical protein
MDFSKLETPETATIHIEHPAQGPLYQDDKRVKPVTIEVYSPGSDQAVKYNREVMKLVSGKMGKKGKLSNISPEEMEDMEIKRLVAMTASVNGIEYKGDKITPLNIDVIYSDNNLGWIKEQVAAKLGSWDDFLS